MNIRQNYRQEGELHVDDRQQKQFPIDDADAVNITLWVVQYQRVS